MTLETSATVFLQLDLFGGTLAISGWCLPAFALAVAWVGELALQAAAMRADR